ncbi:hypothetical protein HDK64DRAFT_274736 [Phyllosticta capitalensis]
MPPGFRSSTSALDRFDDFDPPPRPIRWDREKFERVRSRGPPYDEREVFRYEERAPPPPKPVTVEERIPPSRVEERRFYEDDVYIDRRPGRRPDFLDREEPSPEELANRALAPYRRRTVREVSPPARSSRPPIIRRQSSLDTFDRPSVHHHHYYIDEKEDNGWRPPTGVDIPLPIRRRSRSHRRRSPPPDRYREEEFEEIRHKDAEPDFKEDYREVEIRREKSKVRKPRSERSSRSKHRAPSSTSSSTSSFEEISEAPPLPGKRGKTRMPKRLVHRKAIVELGYPFEEEDDFLIVKRALEKPQIDEIIKISETYRVEDKDKVTTYRYDKEEVIEAPPPPPSVHDPPPPTIIEAPPPPPSVHSSHASHHTHRSHRSHHTHKSHHTHHSHHSPHSHHTHTVRSVSPPREIIEERIEEVRPGPLVVVPEHHHRSDREIREEIRELERERRALQLEREARDLRITEVEYPVTEYEVVEERPPRNIIRVDKDHKVVRSRTRSRPPNPKLVAAMMSTLT